jgi:Ca-activated chloride channel family protein
MQMKTPSSILASVLAMSFAAGCGAYAESRSTLSAPPSPPREYQDFAAKKMEEAPYPAKPAAGIAQPAPEPVGTESFIDHGVNPFVDAKQDRLSTFSIDVDTASYAFARRLLVREGRLPPFASVRAEEFLNSFDYGYAPPDGEGTPRLRGDGTEAARAPFAVHFAAAPSPLAPGHHLVRIGVQAKQISAQERQPVHLVYLVDVSGSMSAPDRLPLAKRSIAMLTETLKPGDTVAVCTYAGDTRVVLPPTGIDQKAKILQAIEGLNTNGGTAMASGIQLAYDLASKTLVKGHLNRVVVLSDGDANIGPSGHEAILKTIQQYKDKGITLSTVGFGSGNYKDAMMEQLADKGDGNYTYIDSEDQARKVFTEQVDGLLQVIARDVKIQVQLDPNVIKRYRLVGYEKRAMANKDFRNDKVDAGEVGAGHSVTALYDVELVSPTKPGLSRPHADVGPLASPPIIVRIRHKPAKNELHGGSDVAVETAYTMSAKSISSSFEEAPEDFRFAVSVAAFAEHLRQSPHAASFPLEEVARIAGASAHGRKERLELVSLVEAAEKLERSTAVAR